MRSGLYHEAKLKECLALSQPWSAWPRDAAEWKTVFMVFFGAK
jgi:hypothetical protein